MSDPSQKAIDSNKHDEREATSIEGGEERILAELTRLHEQLAAIEQQMQVRRQNHPRS
ncbi:MAG: hypothetical protein H6R26_1752 [Proteobacteria bacterium]|nr:hypothetical protein [Pseudomonadota bacterium]